MLQNSFYTRKMRYVRSKMRENISPWTKFSTRLNFRTQGPRFNLHNTSIRILLRQLRPKATTSLKTAASVYHCDIALDREDGQKDSSLFTASRRRLCVYESKFCTAIFNKSKRYFCLPLMQRHNYFPLCCNLHSESTGSNPDPNADGSHIAPRGPGRLLSLKLDYDNLSAVLIQKGISWGNDKQNGVFWKETFQRYC